MVVQLLPGAIDRVLLRVQQVLDEKNQLDLLATCRRCGVTEFGSRLRCTNCGQTNAGFTCDSCGAFIRVL